MSSVNVKIDKKKIEQRLKKAENLSNQLIQDGFQFFKNLTPIDQGHARRNTSLNGNTIEASYPYASVLDAGRGYRDGQMRGSKQAPKGMSGPTKEHMRRLASKLAKEI